MQDLKRLLRYLGPYRKDMILGASLIVVETFFELLIPLLMADLIDVGVANHDVGYIWQKGIEMGICALLALVTGLLYARFAAKPPTAGVRRFDRRSMKRCSSLPFPI